MNGVPVVGVPGLISPQADPLLGCSGPVVVTEGVRIALVGTYAPRRCGIATFTRDLAQALSGPARIEPMALAVTEPGGRYDYPPEVRYEIRQAMKGDYARAAEFLNYSDVRLVLIQHEYGIFGGDDGAYVLDLISALRVPCLVTLHTVLKAPSESQRNIVRRMAIRCAGLVVMSRTAADLLTSSYGIPADKIQIIAHGIPEMAPRDQEVLKTGFGIPGQRMLLTFGLLGPNKGIETVIQALPQLVREFPRLVYFVVGATHPGVVRRQGEAYRTMLTRQAADLGIARHVVFRDQFVTTDELCSYLQAADIFVSPYLNEAQVTSGALSYAMGAGAAAVSTPYWHASELLDEGRGRLFPFGDSEALVGAIAGLLRSPEELGRLRSAAFDFTRSMLWPRVGEAYVELAHTVLAKGATTEVVQPPRALAAALPELRLDHLLRMTDDTGIIQHATFTVPARQTGYCVDDNARALIVALASQRLHRSPETAKLVSTYLAYLHFAQTAQGGFDNFLGYDRVCVKGDESDDCLGRAIWALGTAVKQADDEGQRRLAKQMFAQALPRVTKLGPRGTASTMLGLCAFLGAEPGHGAFKELLAQLTAKLVACYQDEATDDWNWFEPTLTYDNALLPLALFRSYGIAGDRAALRVGRESLDFLEQICFASGRLVLVGNAGWHSRGGEKAHADEQPTDAAAFVLAFRGAHLATGDPHHLRRMRESFAWFLGANRLRSALYNFTSGGCGDGLGAASVNQNEGAESTISFLLSLQEMMDLAGEGLETAEGAPLATN
jgi:glycosyltransferase involved in cell wall biosynthesis